jgi:hypothetical protein
VLVEVGVLEALLVGAREQILVALEPLRRRAVRGEDEDAVQVHLVSETVE